MFLKSDLPKASQTLLAVMSFWNQIKLHDPSLLKFCRHANDYKSVIWLMINIFLLQGILICYFIFFSGTPQVWLQIRFDLSASFFHWFTSYLPSLQTSANWGARLRRLTVRKWFLVWNKRDPKKNYREDFCFTLFRGTIDCLAGGEGPIIVQSLRQRIIKSRFFARQLLCRQI